MKGIKFDKLAKLLLHHAENFKETVRRDKYLAQLKGEYTKPKNPKESAVLMAIRNSKEFQKPKNKYIQDDDVEIYAPPSTADQSGRLRCFRRGCYTYGDIEEKHSIAQGALTKSLKGFPILFNSLEKIAAELNCSKERLYSKYLEDIFNNKTHLKKWDIALIPNGKNIGLELNIECEICDLDNEEKERRISKEIPKIKRLPNDLDYRIVLSLEVKSDNEILKFIPFSETYYSVIGHCLMNDSKTFYEFGRKVREDFLSNQVLKKIVRVADENLYKSMIGVNNRGKQINYTHVIRLLKILEKLWRQSVPLHEVLKNRNVSEWVRFGKVDFSSDLSYLKGDT